MLFNKSLVLLVSVFALSACGGSSTKKATTNQPTNPSIEQPGTQEPNTQQPGTQEPNTQQPGTQEPNTQQPGTQEPNTQQPGTQEPEAIPNGSVSGLAHDGVLINANVYVKSQNLTVLAQSTTDENGLYSISLNGIPTQTITINAENGQYKEEYSGSVITPSVGDIMKAKINYIQGSQISTSVTLYTTMASGLADYYISNGTIESTAVELANAKISALLGLDIQAVQPVDITNSNNGAHSLNDSVKYAFFTAASSPMTAWISKQNNSPLHSQYNSIAFIQKAYEDIKYDGLLNGIGANGKITMGTYELSADTYRRGIAANLLVMANHHYNKTGITPEDLLYAAEEFSNSRSELYGSDLPIALNTITPVLANPNWSNNQYISGTYTFSVDVGTAIGGISRTSLKIGSTTYEPTTNKIPEFVVDTTKLTNGEYPLVLTVRSSTGAETTLNSTINVLNDKVAPSAITPANNEKVKGVVPISVSLNSAFGLDKIEIFVNNEKQTITSNAPYLASYNSVTSGADGERTLKVVLTTVLGEIEEYESKFVVDNIAPVVTINALESTSIATTKTLKFTATGGDNKASLYVNNTLHSHVFVEPGVEQSVSITFASQGDNIVRIDYSDEAGNSVSANKTYSIDTIAPVITGFQIISDTSSSSPGDIRFTATDNVGIVRYVLKYTTTQGPLQSHVAYDGPDKITAAVIYMNYGSVHSYQYSSDDIQATLTVYDAAGNSTSATTMTTMGYNW